MYMPVNILFLTITFEQETIMYQTIDIKAINTLSTIIIFL